jgi:hypothetical protein
VCKIDHSCLTVLGIIIAMKKPPLTLEQILKVRCPTCGVAPGEKCELSTGLPRFEPHQARRLAAEDMGAIINPR